MNATDFLASLLKLMSVYLFIMFLKSMPAEYANIQKLVSYRDDMYSVAIYLGLGFNFEMHNI